MSLLQIFLSSILQTLIPDLDQPAKVLSAACDSMSILQQILFPCKVDFQSIFKIPSIGKISFVTVFQSHLIYQTNPFLNQALNLSLADHKGTPMKHKYEHP